MPQNTFSVFIIWYPLKKEKNVREQKEQKSPGSRRLQFGSAGLCKHLSWAGSEQVSVSTNYHPCNTEATGLRILHREGRYFQRGTYLSQGSIFSPLIFFQIKFAADSRSNNNWAAASNWGPFLGCSHFCNDADKLFSREPLSQPHTVDFLFVSLQSAFPLSSRQIKTPLSP